MAQPGSHVETEVKLKVPEAAAARKRLLAAGFSVSVGRVLERNTVYDTPDLQLRARQCLLRLRTAGPVCTITFKGPEENGPYKIRQETEFTASDPSPVDKVFRELGYAPVFRYEKYRTEFVQNVRQGTAVLDETPIGAFLELEGDPRWIDEVAARLGFEKGDYVTASYGRLYIDYCMNMGITPTDMLFSSQPNELSTSEKNA